MIGIRVDYLGSNTLKDFSSFVVKKEEVVSKILVKKMVLNTDVGIAALRNVVAACKPVSFAFPPSIIRWARSRGYCVGAHNNVNPARSFFFPFFLINLIVIKIYLLRVFEQAVVMSAPELSAMLRKFVVPWVWAENALASTERHQHNPS